MISKVLRSKMFSHEMWYYSELWGENVIGWLTMNTSRTHKNLGKSSLILFIWCFSTYDCGHKKAETSDLEKISTFCYVPLTWNLNTALHWATETVLNTPPQHLQFFTCIYIFVLLFSLSFHVLNLNPLEKRCGLKTSKFCYKAIFH